MTTFRFKRTLLLALLATGLILPDLSINLYAGTLSFQPPFDYPANDYPGAVALSDVNQDGKPDMVVVNYNNISVRLGNGNGTFKAKVDYPTGIDGSSECSVALSDVNRDGKPDIVVTNQGVNKVRVLIGNGNGTFKAKVDYPTGIMPTNTALSDVNRDGKPDIVVTNQGSNSVSVLIGNGDGTFKAKVDYSTGRVPYDTELSDVNRDGKPDMVVINQGYLSPGSVSVLIGNGNGTFKAKVDSQSDEVQYDVTIVDVNHDAIPDMMIGLLEKVRVRLGNGNGTFKAKVDYIAHFPSTAIALSDVNRDDRPDIVFISRSGSALGILIGNGDGTFKAEVLFNGSGQGGGLSAMALSDVNLDGKPDIVVTSYDSPPLVSIILNSTTP